MKRVVLLLAKYTGILVLFLFTFAFVWANWNPPTPGEKAPVVNFIPYDVRTVGDSIQLAKISQAIQQIDGVRGATFNLESGIMSIAYLIDDVDQQTIETAVKQQFHIQLKEKKFQQTGPKCPVGGSLTLVARFKQLLCVRD